MSKPLCRYSGTELGGYIEEHRHTTIRVMCIKCWRRVDAVAIEPRWKTDLRTDGQAVEVLYKRVQDHEFGTACAMRVRRDHLRYEFWLAVALTVWGFLGIAWQLGQRLFGL